MTDTLVGPYGSFCDRLWLDWLADRLPASAFGGGEFDRKSAPEPWLEFRAGSNPLVAVTTNPGGSMDHQSHAAVVGRTSPIIKPSQTYREATEGLGHFYETSLEKASPARHRIKAFVRLAESAGYEGLLQVEACPFHSAKLPNKQKLVRAVESNSNSLLREYAEHLRAFLASHHVVGLSAISSTASLTAAGTQQAMGSSVWLPWFATLIGLDPRQATHIELTRKGEGQAAMVSAAALVATVNGRRKALVLMMGGNRLPGESGLAALAGALKQK